jgi:DNA polymerase I-like protein with 3'-5' exonuclease and polymerase domains
MMAESYMNKPRERLDKELHRGSGKVGMFAIPYGASGTLIERQTYALTGVKPDPGTGDKIIEAYKSGFSLASTYLEERERDVEERGYFQSVSGRIRHSPVKLLQGLNDISRYEYESIVSSLKREFRNYPLQEIVAATMARAHAMLLDVLQDRSMKSRPMLLLYDALTVVGPLEERHDVKNLLQWAMSDANTWETPGGTLQFEVDIDHSFRWATKLTESERKLLLD